MKQQRSSDLSMEPKRDTGINPPAEPIAVVGMACRFPGAPSISAFWDLLESGGNAVSEILPGSGNPRVDDLFSNIPNPPGACRYCSYVDDIDQFDAGFFRISPVEARFLDPQQRMMLETSWQALEDAGINPDQLKGSRTGVYTGISNDEYRMLVVESDKPAEAASCLYALSGTNLNGTSGRVSFVLGLMGPAKAVDAACASSLVSVHDAVSDLQQGKTDLAIAGGVQAILNGRVFELRADSMMLSSDGQCKAFDASANGYVRGEGCGVVILKRLREAQADGDRIRGVIRGSAVNHGGASSGLTVPHTPALEQVIEAALAQAGIAAAEVDYLEAHGTGTSVGDPIEIDAVSAVYGRNRSADCPLLVGSVKTNVGHLESAAGIAGLIKAVLVMQRKVIPKHLHFRDPNPSIDWDQLPLHVTSSMMDLPQRDGRRRLAGINSFGISGTNAHLIVEEFDPPDGVPYGPHQVAGSARTVRMSLPSIVKDLPLPEKKFRQRMTRLLPLSGKSERALRELAGRYLTWLKEQAGELAATCPDSGALLSDMAWTAWAGRSHFDHRAGVVFHDAGSLQNRLENLVESGKDERQLPKTRVAFAYTGQGSQWTGMGAALYESEPVVRAVLDRCEEAFRSERETSLLDVMFHGKGEGKLDDTAWEQPALYALECALTALWGSVGVFPDVVVGHSVGELAAAQAAGVYSLEDGMRFAIVRGALLSATAPGAMSAVFASPEQVGRVVEAVNAASAGVGLGISADNGSHQVVSGPVDQIESLLKRCESEGFRARRLNTARAFHSALLEPALDALEASLHGVEIKPPTLTVVSNLSGRTVGADQALDGAYWKRHAREAVAFARGVRTLAELGVDLVVELGPRPLLGAMVLSAWPESAQTPAPAVVPSLCPPSAEASEPTRGEDFMAGVAQVYQAGLPIRFEGLFSGEERRRILIPGYPFQRERYWIGTTKRRRPGTGHPLLGGRHESASGEVTYETDVFPSDPEWMSDHRVFGRVIAPAALYGAMAASAGISEGSGAVIVEDIQLYNALVFTEENPGERTDEESRRLQVVLGSAGDAASRRVQIYSKGREEGWTVHVEGRIDLGTPLPESGGQVDLDRLKASLSPVDVPNYYRSRSATGIYLGPAFRTLGRVWSRPGEALGEVSLPEPGQNELDIHPLVLDGCFQVVAATRNPGGAEGETTYLPFGWERFWLTGRLPEKVICHVRMSEASQEEKVEANEPLEVLSGELRIYDPDGTLLGGLSGYTVKRATRAALLATVEGVQELLYEVVWRENALAPGLVVADFLPSPKTVAAGSGLLSGYLEEEGVGRDDRSALLWDLERWARSRALATLEELGWKRKVGARIDPEALRQRLEVGEAHKRLFRRMLEMLAKSGVLGEKDSGFVVKIGTDDPLPDEIPDDIEKFVAGMTGRYPHGSTEIGLFRRCGAGLTRVLRAQLDPLTLLFSSGEPTPADLYLKAPVARAANRILKETVQALVSGLPEGRRLRVIEVGAGTGSATAAILPELPDGQFDYMYTDISAGFFSEVEARFDSGPIEYRPLDIEKDPIGQGFDANAYDLLVASNVLHATRYLEETLAHCRRLLAPSGHLVALENLSGQGWMDLTFGQLDGWWRFADYYRPHHALAGPAVWRRALGDAGFGEVEILGVDESDSTAFPDKGVIVAQGPADILEPPGVWVLAADDGGLATGLASELAARNQSVLVVGEESSKPGVPRTAGGRVTVVAVEMEQRESWCSLIQDLPPDVPFNGVVHLLALDDHGAEATSEEIAKNVRRAGASALAMVQGISDANATPRRGVWFLTRGAQLLEREPTAGLAGAALWGFGKAVAMEASELQSRMIDLDPAKTGPVPDLVNELLYPDPENHIAYRSGRRQVARLVRANTETERLTLPDESAWVLTPDPDGVFEKPGIKPLPSRPLGPKEVRVSVEASGLNFWDVFRSLGFIEEGNLGREMCGHVLDVGEDASSICVGDHVVGLGFGAFASEMVTREELVVLAPPGISVTKLATVPSAFVSAALSYEFSGLKHGERVLIHAGAGGVGLAAIQLAQVAGAEVFATASAPKQAYLLSLGVENVFDSRQTAFGKEILEKTDGAGVDVVLNSLTGEGFIDASLSCLAKGGRFVEMARRDILSEEEMAATRPDVAYAILELDVMKKTVPARVGRVLRDVMERIATGELKPLIHSRWPLAEAGAALRFMRSARHLGKIVLAAPPLTGGRLRQDRTYLVTGGLGGIGCAVADWLTECGAGVIVLNGRRPPDPEAEVAINSLRERGFTVRVELADVADAPSVDKMLARIARDLPPLGGVIHSVGVLSDGALTNQSWERFEEVLWPKILGAWHLHRATVDLDLDLFILFSSRVGVMGNPGQANHASANAFLDQLAIHRRALGLPGQAIAWGTWSEIGEAAEQRERIERPRAVRGDRWFTPQQGIRAFDRLVRQDVTNSVVMSIDWQVFEEAVKDRPPLLEDLLSTTSETGVDSPALANDLISRFQGAPAAERESLLVSFLQQELQAVLRLPTAPEPTVGFFDLGMDSLMAVELRNRLNRAFVDAYTASNTVVFDYPDIAMLARHLATELSGVSPAPVLQAQPEPERESTGRPEEEQIAIVGMACRFPGSPDISTYWRQLEAGTDAVAEGRRDSGPWNGILGDPAAEEAIYRRGGFVDGLDQFDARFFGIRPIEARMMDPRQRLLLETSWQALEDAGMDPSARKGTRTGVYVGLGASEYRDLVAGSGQDDSYLGTAPSVTIGRIAFALGLMGPAVPLDMTCASSLVAVHQAAASLRGGEVDLALAGGVHAVLSPSITRFMSEFGMLSKQGQCRTFDAAADGFVRGEGCGVVILKRLSDAKADGDLIWGVVKGSAVNQNGASAALTVPNGTAQEQVLEEALSQAGVPPSEVDYLEVHATGSPLGDPIEVRAAAAVYGKGRAADRPLLLGTVKTNIGHLESAAGIAGLIKVLLAMKHGIIPKHLHFQTPNPHMPWNELPVRVTSKKMDWPLAPDHPPRAGVSAFAISGTNAHIVVEGYGMPETPFPASPAPHPPAGSAKRIGVSLPESVQESPALEELSPRRMRLLPLSGKSDDALRELATRYLSWLDDCAAAFSSENVPQPVLSDMAWTAGTGRSHFGHRAGILFEDTASLKENLMDLAASAGDHCPRGAAKVAFVYPDENSCWTGMGEVLYESEPVVRAILDHCDEVLRMQRGISLLDVMFGRSEGLGTPAWTQPATYSLECALTALWSSVGVRPNAVLGMGSGEISAAQAAGVLTLEEGLRFAAHRGSLMEGLAGGGKPDTGGLDELEAALEEVVTASPSLVLVNQVTGRVVEAGETLDGAHWRRQACEPAAFTGCVETLAGLGVEVVVEVGPDGVLGPKVSSAWPKPADPAGTATNEAGTPAVLSSMSPSSVNGCGFVENVARGYEAGLPLDFTGLFAGQERRRMSLPGYPFQRQRFWFPSH